MPPSSTKKTGTYALYPRNHPRSISWAIDLDYISKLSPEEARWLAEFVDRHYGGDFRGDVDGDWSVAERREAYRRKNIANSDMYAQLSGAQMLEDMDTVYDMESPVIDLEPTPDYLSSDAYKEALANYRENLAQGRKTVTPKDTPALRRTKKALDRVIRAGKIEAGEEI